MLLRFLFALLTLTATAAPAFAQSMSSGTRNAMQQMSTDKTPPKCAADDPAVWVDSRLDVYFQKDSKYYGHTSHGGYACQSDAVKAGAHASKSASMAATAAPSPPAAGVGPNAGAPSAGPNPPQPRQSGTTSPEP